MMLQTVDRSHELEQRLRVIRVGSEDTCCFWRKRDDSLIAMRRCYFCAHYDPDRDNESRGSCIFKEVGG